MTTPATIGPYVIDGELGRGGMGVVYRGRSPNGDEVAVKTVLPDASPELVRRFAREASIRLDHPNVIRVIDAGTDVLGAPYIVFELLRGESLDARIARKRMDASAAADLLLQVCAGVQAVHSAGLVHRDLKPANVFCCVDGIAKVMDFGIARAVVGTKLTEAGTVLGTVSYLSPEQACGRQIDERTDVWALGVMGYELLMGVPPFDRTTAVATLVAILQDDPPHLACPIPQLGTVLRRCLERDPERRWPTVGALAAALRDARLSPPEAPPSSAVRSIPAGEQRVVCVLIATEVTDPYRLTGEIEGAGGASHVLLGNAVVGVLGQHSWEGDEIDRATAIALRCRGVAARIGIGAGRAWAAGNSLAGKAVRAAERALCANADGIVIEGQAALLASAWYELQPVGHDLWVVVGERRDSPAWRETPLVGRGAQLAALTDAWGSCLREQSTVTVAVCGPPGSGKSRLLRELESRLALLPGISTVVLQPRLRGRESAFGSLAWGLLGVARATVPVADRVSLGDPAVLRTVLEQFAQCLAHDNAGAAALAETLGERLPIEVADTVATLAARSDPQLMQDLVRAAIRDCLRGLRSRGPLAILVDDADRADAASMALVEELHRPSDGAGILVVLACPPEARSRLPFPRDDMIEVVLPPLSPHEVATLTAGIVGRRLMPGEVDDLVERGEGNPLYVEQIALAMREQGPAIELQRVPLPLSIEGVIQTRLDRLSPVERELCKALAAFGRASPASCLERMIGPEAPAAAMKLIAASVIVVSSTENGEELSYRFRNAMVGEAAYRMIAPESRRELHARIADLLEADLRSEADEVARHFERSGDHARAAQHYARAATSAAARGDAQAALDLSGRALAIGGEAAPEFTLRMLRADCLRFLRRRDEQAAEIERAIAIAPDDMGLARAMTEQVAWLVRVGRTSDAVRIAPAAVAAARRASSSEVVALALARFGEALSFSGRHGEAEEVLREALQAAASAGPLVRGLLWELRARLAAQLGDLGEARDGFARAALVYREAGDVRRAAANDLNVADAYNRVGAHVLAVDALEAALAGCRRVGNPLVEGYALANLGYALLNAGRMEEAVAAIVEAQRLATTGRDARLGVMSSTYRARALVVAARFAEAADLAVRAAREAAAAGQASFEVVALAIAARATLNLGDVHAALQLSERALGRRDELGGVEEDEAEVFLVRVDALLAAGRSAEADDVKLRGVNRLHYVARRIRSADMRTRFLRDVPTNRALLGGAS